MIAYSVQGMLCWDLTNLLLAEGKCGYGFHLLCEQFENMLSTVTSNGFSEVECLASTWYMSTVYMFTMLGFF